MQIMSPEELYGPWEVEGYTVAVDFADGIRLVASRDGKRLRSIPPSLREAGDMAWIKLALEAATQHHRQLRELLERAMTEAVPLSADDLALLALDPVGRAMLSRILVEQDGVVGRPLPDEWLLETVHGNLARLGAPVTVVHPVRLEGQGTLEAWGRWLNRQPFKQPFKQVWRELYRVTAADREARTSSSRFAGERIRWDQTRALLEGRGWYRVTKSNAERIFRQAKLTAHLEFRTPAARGFSREDVVIGRVYFLPVGEQSRNREHPGLPLDKVPLRLFSETLRDVALIAQVAGRTAAEG